MEVPMSTQYARQFSRRRFLSGLTLAGTVGLLGLYPRPVAAEPPPETTTLRLVRSPAICIAPYYVAGELLQCACISAVASVQVGAPLSMQVLMLGKGDTGLKVVGTPRGRLDAGN